MQRSRNVRYRCMLIDLIEHRCTESIIALLRAHSHLLYERFFPNRCLTIVDYLFEMDLSDVIRVIPEIVRHDSANDTKKLGDIFGLISGQQEPHSYLTKALRHKNAQYLQILVDICGVDILYERPNPPVNQLAPTGETTLRFLLSTCREDEGFNEKLTFMLTHVPDLLVDDEQIDIIRFICRRNIPFTHELLLEQDYDLICQMLEEHPELWSHWELNLEKLIPVLARREQGRFNSLSCGGLLEVVIRIINM